MSTGVGMGNMLKQLEQLKARIAKMQEDLARRHVEASVGGGMVRAVVNGRNEVLSVSIDPSVIDPKDPEMLQDLIVAAVNEGLRKAQGLVTEEMRSLTGGLGIHIPGLF